MKSIRDMWWHWGGGKKKKKAANKNKINFYTNNVFTQVFVFQR
jgi:hypothetical protein